jgi:hypothetical protein
MSVSTQRLKCYRSLATLPAVAMAGGLASVTDTAEADIVYQATSFTLGGPGSEPYAGPLDMGFASILFFAGSNSDGPEALFAAKGSQNLVLIGNNQKGANQGKVDGPLINFQAGELIPEGGSLIDKGFGVLASNGSTKSGGSVSKSKGEWSLNGAESVSGYMGFAFFNNGFEGGSAANYGWVSLSWDGAYLTIDGYAIETDANVGIEAGAIPAPGAIGLLGLAAGAAGMRRKRQA